MRLCWRGLQNASGYTQISWPIGYLVKSIQVWSCDCRRAPANDYYQSDVRTSALAGTASWAKGRMSVQMCRLRVNSQAARAFLCLSSRQGDSLNNGLTVSAGESGDYHTSRCRCRCQYRCFESVRREKETLLRFLPQAATATSFLILEHPCSLQT